MTEPKYSIADLYATVESEAFNHAGKPIVLLRLAHPPHLVHAHLTSLRPMPADYLSLSELGEKILKLRWEYKVEYVHITGDWPEINNFRQLVTMLSAAEFKILLNSYGAVPIDEYTLNKIDSLYVIAKPGLIPLHSMLAKAAEIRFYVTPKPNSEFEEVMKHLFAHHSDDIRKKLYAMPFTLDQECIDKTISLCLEMGIKCCIPLCRVLDLDKHFQTNSRSVEVFHLQDKTLEGTSAADPYPRLNSETSLTNVNTGHSRTIKTWAEVGEGSSKDDTLLV